MMVLVTVFFTTILKIMIVPVSVIREVSNIGITTTLLPFQPQSLADIYRANGLFYFILLGFLSLFTASLETFPPYLTVINIPWYLLLFCVYLQRCVQMA